MAVRDTSSHRLPFVPPNVVTVVVSGQASVCYLEARGGDLRPRTVGYPCVPFMTVSEYLRSVDSTYLFMFEQEQEQEQERQATLAKVSNAPPTTGSPSTPQPPPTAGSSCSRRPAWTVSLDLQPPNSMAVVQQASVDLKKKGCERDLASCTVIGVHVSTHLASTP